MLFLKIKSINFLNLPAFISLSKYSIFYYYYFHYRPTDKIHVHHVPLSTQNMKKKIKQKQILHGKKKKPPKRARPMKGHNRPCQMDKRKRKIWWIIFCFKCGLCIVVYLSETFFKIIAYKQVNRGSTVQNFIRCKNFLKINTFFKIKISNFIESTGLPHFN